MSKQGSEVHRVWNRGKRGGCERHPALADNHALRVAYIYVMAAALAAAGLGRRT